jgi:hypothetical protein
MRRKIRMERCLDLFRKLKGEKGDTEILKRLGMYPSEAVEQARAIRLKEMEEEDERVRWEVEEEKRRLTAKPDIVVRTDQELRRMVERCAKIYEEANAEKSTTKANEMLDRMREMYEKEIWNEEREI